MFKRNILDQLGMLGSLSPYLTRPISYTGDISGGPGTHVMGGNIFERFALES